MIPRLFLFLLCTGLLPAAESTSARLTLASVLQAVRDHSPEVASARADARMGGQMALAAYAWMPPQVSLELMGLNWPSPDLGQSMTRKLALTQELPFPGRTWAAGRVATHEAARREAEAAMVERQALRQASEAFFDFAAADRLSQGLDLVSEATHEMARTSAKRASFGQLDRMGQFMDAMLAMEDSDVDSMHPMVDQQRRMAQTQLNRLMGADPARPLPPPVLDLDALAGEPVPALDQALRAAEARSPELRQARESLAGAEAARALALSGWLPDVMVQGSVSQDNSGQQESGAMLGLSVPWLWFWKQSGEAGAANAALDKAAQDLAAAELSVRGQVRDALGELQAVTEALRITTTRTLPKATRGLELARSGFRTTALGPPEVLMGVQDYRMTLEKLSAQISALGRARAMLAMLTADSAFDGAKP